MTRTVVAGYLRSPFTLARKGALARVMELTLHGTTRNVIFRHEDGPIEAEPVVFYNDPSDITFYRATVLLREL